MWRTSTVEKPQSRTAKNKPTTRQINSVTGHSNAPPVVRFARTRSGGFKRLDLSADSSSGPDNSDGGPDQSPSVRTQPDGWIRIVRPSEDNPKEWVMETIYGQPQGAEKRLSQAAQTVTRVVQKLKVGLDQGDPRSSYEPTEMPGLSPDEGVPSGAQEDARNPRTEHVSRNWLTRVQGQLRGVSNRVGACEGELTGLKAMAEEMLAYLKPS
ncbi:MAG: hypothetical protein GY696_12270, partial [Gammaproteobacteria bacterium]|nr:hypothetical protein [Gammaproteobacteria bacterium]